MESFGYEPSAQSDGPTQAQPETRREDLTQHAPSPREAFPEQFRGYKVLKRMTGTTGEAQTFLVEKENQQYVLKLYHPGKTPDREVLRHIRQMTEEGKRYFPILYEHGEEGGKYHEVIEYIAGGHLGAWIKKTPSEKRLEKLPDIVRQITEALHILHERKLIHRDLKPANVLLRSEEPLELVLIDFGISRQIDREATKHATVVFKGTPAYCAPEEFAGLFGREADWWHLGIVAYEVIKGEHPFAGVNQAVISYQIITQDIALPDTTDRYRVLLRGLLSRNPKERWGYEQVRAWLEGKVEFAQETSPQSPIQYSLQDWEKAGFTEESARLWAGLGLSPEEAQSFDEAGFSVDGARPWVEAGFKNGHFCIRWQDAGFKPEEVQVYRSFGLNIEHAKKLKAWKITALHLSPYRGQKKLTDSLKHLLNDLDSLKANPHSPPEWVKKLLKKSEVSSTLSAKLKQQRYYYGEPTQSDLLTALGGEFASAMVKQLNPDLLIEAAQQEVPAAELLTAQVYGIPLKDYLNYRRHGLSPKQARELLQAGVKPEDYAKGAEQGLTYSEILNVARRGVNLSEYLYLRKYGITLRESTFVAQGLQQIAIEGPLSVSSPFIIEKSSLTLKNLSLKTLRVSDSQVSLEGCSFPQGEDFPSPRLEIVSSEVALEGVRIAGGKVGIHVRDSRLALREVSLTGLGEVGIRVEGQTEVKGDGRLEIVSSEVALEGVRIAGGKVGIQVWGSRLTLREVSLTGLGEVGMRVGSQTAVEGEQISIRQCGRGMEVRPGARVQLTRPTLTANRTGIVVEGAALVLKGPGALTHHQGPAILIEKNGSLSAEELTFEKNQKDSSTGQIHLVGASKVSLEKITVQNSEAKGLYAKDCPDIRMTNSTFTSNRYGAIRLVKSRLIASEVKILENGGGHYRQDWQDWQVALSDQAHLKIEKSSIEHGEAGGIYAERSGLEVADCIVADHKLDGLHVTESSTARVVGGTFRANLNDQIAGYNNSTVEVRDAVLDGDGKSQRGLYMEKGHVAIKKCQIHSHNHNGVRVEGGSGCTIEDSQLENNGLASSEERTYAQLFVKEVEKVALSDLRVIGGKGEGVHLWSCKNASLSDKSIIRGNQGTGLWAWQTQLTVEKTEFQDNGKAGTSYRSYRDYGTYIQIPYYYQIFADKASNVHLKEVQIYEGQHGGGIGVWRGGTVKLEGGSIHGHGKEAIEVEDSGSKMIVIGARIFENAQQTGAQVIVKDSGTAEIEDARIQDSPHGGVFVGKEGMLILKRCHIHNNQAYNLKADSPRTIEIDMPLGCDSSKS
jgi:serine/threonine protein kinase